FSASIRIVDEVVPVKLAVNVVLVAGVLIVWDVAPPSDQELNVYVVLPTVCGLTTPMVRGWPTVPVIVVPLAIGPPSSMSCSPAGLLASVKWPRFGWISTNVLPVAPFESVAVRMKRYHTSGDVSGKLVTIEPLPTPLNVWNGWKCSPV